MPDDGAASGSPVTGPIVGGILAGLIVIFGCVIIFRLALRRIRRTQNHDPERTSNSDDVEKAVVAKRPSAESEGEAAAADAKSLATRTIDYTEETADSNHSEPLPNPKQEDTRPLVSPPFAAKSPSSALQVAKPTARLSAATDTETQSMSATSFATAPQSQRNSEHVS